MHFIVTISERSHRLEWRDYAILRDNIQHYIEGGAPSADFECLHGFERAVDEGQHRVNAVALRAEVQRAWYELRRVHVCHSAISRRTHAIVAELPVLPLERSTRRRELAERLRTVPGREAMRLQEVVEPFVTGILRVTQNAQQGDELLIRREGTPPSYVALQSSHLLAPPSTAAAR